MTYMPSGLRLAMVDSTREVTNFHVPSNVIVDASMPTMIRDSGSCRGADGELHETKALLPDRCYSTIYKTIVEDCRLNGAFDPVTMGSVPNVGLMAQGAEEYGSHDKTFIAAGPGTIRVVVEPPARRCSSRRLKRATFSARARPRTPPSAIGSSWRFVAPG